MAVANYQSTYGTLPPAYVMGPDGRPWHSWRVLILPFLEQHELYNAYHFDEPWDGPNNARLAAQIGGTFRRPEAQGRSIMTTFVVVTGAETAFPGAKALAESDIHDPRDRTILFAEIRDSEIPWMEPRDLRFEDMSYIVNGPGVGGLGSPYGGSRVILLDHSRLTLKDSTRPADIKAMLTANGGEIVELDDE